MDLVKTFRGSNGISKSSEALCLVTGREQKSDSDPTLHVIQAAIREYSA
jgi:hypothetical protein